MKCLHYLESVKAQTAPKFIVPCWAGVSGSSPAMPLFAVQCVFLLSNIHATTPTPFPAPHGLASYRAWGIYIAFLGSWLCRNVVFIRFNGCMQEYVPTPGNHLTTLTLQNQHDVATKHSKPPILSFQYPLRTGRSPFTSSYQRFHH
jgi:hypothetical protein